MPELSKEEATEKLAADVAKAKPTTLDEINSELFPGKSEGGTLSAEQLARHVRSGLEAEEIVDLWNVVFPQDHNVWYDEENDTIHFNDEVAGYAEAD